MSFPRYPEYKDSGVEWLGQVPEHWLLPKLKSIASFSGGGTPSRENLGYWNGDIPWVSPKDMKVERIVGAEESITEEGLRSSASNLLPPGRVLMVVRSGILKHTIPIAINETAVALNQDMKALNFDGRKCVGRFFLRWVQGHNDQLLLAWAKQGATVESIEHTYLAETVIPLPDIGEQRKIAAFLDRETTKIDALVVEQRRLMALLKEKRQAVISHAVTRGLNPHFPMKPSGIEWLGDVPAHWRVVPLRWAARCCSGDGLSSTEVECVVDDGHTIRVIGGNGLMGFTDQKNVDHSLLAVGRVGALCGNVHIVNPPAWITDNALVLDPDSAIFDLQFLGMTLRSRNLNDIASKTAQPLITGTQVSDQRIPCPPLSEQEAIAAYLTEESAKFDTLTIEAQRAIDLLQERRTALISAAVTGQIDVRRANC